MKTLLHAIAAVTLLATNVNAASSRNKITNEPTGVITFENAFVDFGTIKRGQKLTAKFPYKNSGSGPLTIQGVQAPCDCTTVEASKGRTTAPGEGGVVEVVFDSTDYSGRVSKAITVVTNERTMPDRTLTVSALVNSDVESDPPLVDFGDVVINQMPQQQVRLKNLMKTELKIEKLRYNEELLDVGYAKEGREWVIHVKLKPTAPIGFIKDTIYVKNNSQSLPEMPIPVRGTVKGQIAYSPSYLEFGSVASNDKANRQLTLSASDSFDITSNKIELMVNGAKSETAEKLMKVSVVPADKNGKKISLELANPGTSPGSVHGKVLLETTNPQQKTITIDFYAFFR